MIQSIRESARLLPLVGVVMLIGLGCAGSVSHMDEITSAPSLEPGKARIVFMRPSSTAYAIQSTVFELDGESTLLAGIVAAKKKIAYDVAPGEHLFMVVGEAADFMSADVEAGKTYYALVTPRIGAWKARFGLRPVHRPEVDNGRADGWLSSCKWVAKNADSSVWATSNVQSIEAKREKYLAAWYKKAEADRPRLEPQDGRS
jgi:hypothetical protein